MRQAIVVLVLLLAPLRAARATYVITTAQRAYTLDVINEGGRDLTRATVTIDSETDRRCRAAVTAAGYQAREYWINYEPHQQLVLRRIVMRPLPLSVTVEDLQGHPIGATVQRNLEEIDAQTLLLNVRVRDAGFTRFRGRHVTVEGIGSSWANAWGAPDDRHVDLRVPYQDIPTGPALKLTIRIPSDAELPPRGRQWARLR